MRRDPVGALYLFGSQARGDARPDSDHDILVVTWDAQPDEATRLAIMGAVGAHCPPLDVHYVTAAEFEWRKRFANTIECAVDREGLVLLMTDGAGGRDAAAQQWSDKADMAFQWWSSRC